MGDDKITVLFVEDDPADFRLIKQSLVDAGEASFQIERVRGLSEALERLGKESVDVVLLDLTLPDASGIGTVDRIVKAAPKAMVLVLGATGDDDQAARQAVLHGAHDYLAK